MSRGFVKEYEDQWLHEIQPTLTALIRYLTWENNGFDVYVKRTFENQADGKEAYEMSNGLNYSVNAQSQWYILE